LGPPAGNGTISRIGFVGKSCAMADAGNSSSDNPISSVRKIPMQASSEMVLIREPAEGGRLEG
jgi:hypothetical protein